MAKDKSSNLKVTLVWERRPRDYEKNDSRPPKVKGERGGTQKTLAFCIPGEAESPCPKGEQRLGRGASCLRQKPRKQKNEGNNLKGKTNSRESKVVKGNDVQREKAGK